MATDNEIKYLGQAGTEQIVATVKNLLDGKLDEDYIPSVTTSDAGKFLRVSSEGKWVAETVQNAEEVAY